ncbi:MAG: ribosome maturation factor RimP [Clostridiales bacterium]|nr:ribosome maturation factor RimP [Clostridiales bacterium]
MNEMLLKKAEEIVSPILNGLGLELVEVNTAKEYGKLNLNIIIYKKGGITLNDLEAAHNAINEPLDALDDEIPGDYVLNVSSPGLDRPIVTTDDFRRAMDTEITVNLKEKLEGKTRYEGKLVSYSDSEIELELNNKKQTKIIKISRTLIGKAMPLIKF